MPRWLLKDAALVLKESFKCKTYMQTHKYHDNSMSACSTGAIALRPTGSQQGVYFFFSLTTGRILDRNNWTSLPMSNDIISRVEHMSRGARSGIWLTDRNNNPILEIDENSEDKEDEDYVDNESSTDSTTYIS